MKHHPEQADDEIYMGNEFPHMVERSMWKTSRLGTTALSSTGEPLAGSRMRPWFIHMKEIESRIEACKHRNDEESADWIRALQPMLDNRTAFPVEPR